MYRNIFLVLIAAQITLSQTTLPGNCNIYCKECNVSNNSCTTCATYEGKTLTSGSSCMIPNIFYLFATCRTIIMEGTTSGTYTCASSVPSGAPANCRVLKSDGTTCEYCNNSSLSTGASNFYLNGSTCTAVTTAVAYCKKYKDATTCAECIPGYKMSGTSCVVNSTACPSANLNSNGFCTNCTAATEFIRGSLCINTGNSIVMTSLLIMLAKLF